MPDPKKFPHLQGYQGLSERNLREHCTLYEGYVEKYEELLKKFHSVQALGNVRAGADTRSLKVDITFALGAIKNHELFFDILGSDGAEPAGDLATEIIKSFHSIPQYLYDLKQTALTGRGWAWTAFDLERGYLFNYEAGAGNGMPVWNAIPILAIDLYGHSYFYDFGMNRLAYVDTLLAHLSWNRIGKQLKLAQAARAAVR